MADEFEAEHERLLRGAGEVLAAEQKAARARALELERDELKRQVAELNHRLNLLQGSLTWRSTAPLRRVVAKGKRVAQEQLRRHCARHAAALAQATDRTMSELRLVFVLSPWQNAFFHEVAEILCDELRAGGVDATAATEPDRIEPDGDTVFVLLPPHEFLELEGHAWVHEPHLMARTVALERGTAAGSTSSYATPSSPRRAGAVLDFSAHAVAAYSALGVKARHLRFGYAERGIDSEKP